MRRLRVLCCLALLGAVPLLAPPRVLAVEPEALLSRDSVAYLRFDGLTPHQAAIDRSVLGQLYREDFAPLVDWLERTILDGIASGAVADRLLEGDDPDELIALQNAGQQLPALLAYLREHGVVVGAALVTDPAPQPIVTIVFPNGGLPEHRDAVFAAMRILAMLNDTKAVELKIGERAFLEVALDLGGDRYYEVEPGESTLPTEPDGLPTPSLPAEDAPKSPADGAAPNADDDAPEADDAAPSANADNLPKPAVPTARAARAVVRVQADAAAADATESEPGAAPADVENGSLPDDESAGREPSVRVICWQEGDHVVVAIGQSPLPHVLAVIDGTQPSLADHPHLAALKQFADYETAARGYVDTPALAAIVRNLLPDAAQYIDELGLAGLGRFDLFVGFEGDYLRQTYVLHTPGQRNGLLRLLTAKPRDALKLPPMPPDVARVHAMAIDVPDIYETAVETTEKFIGLVEPSAVTPVRFARLAAEQLLGFNLRRDLLETFGSTAVVYNAPSDGMFFMGAALAIEVRDAERLKKTLASISRSLGQLTGVELETRVKQVHGAELHVIDVPAEGVFFLPSYTLHNGWLVVGLFPQSVEGYLARSAGKLPAWEPPPVVAELEKKLLASRPGAKVTAMSCNDPRPGITQVMALAPLIGGLARSFGGADFDVTMIPNSQSVTHKLSHNVGLAIDDGKSVRWESFTTAALPLDMGGLEMFYFSVVFPYIFGF